MEVENKVLVVEDDADTRANLRDILELAGYQVETAASGCEALQHLNQSRFFVILLDRLLPDTTADNLLPIFVQKSPNVPIVIITGYSDLNGITTAIRLGIVDYILKPINAELLCNTLERIAKMKESEQRVNQAERLANIGQALSILAHEARNSLQQIMFNLQILALKVSNYPELLDFVNNAKKAQRELVLLFEDVQSYSSPLTIHQERLKIRDLCRQVWADLYTLRKDKITELTERIEEDELFGDRFRLQQAFRNLFENAIAASPTQVRVDVHCTKITMQGRSSLQLTVHDNGSGMSHDQLEKAFEPFYTTKSKGTGLGLAITRRIVEAHGGQISVSNDINGGAKFLIVLPQNIKN